MKIKIGKVYQIKSPYTKEQSEYTTNLSWKANVFGTKKAEFESVYTTWETLDTKRVVVLKKATDTEYLASLVSFKDASFKIYVGYLAEVDTSRLEIGCICSIEKLMLTGCRCGAFLEEMGEL